MVVNDFPFLPVLTILPVVGALVVVLLPRDNDKLAKQVALAYGIHEKVVPRWVRAKRIPAPVEKGHRYTRWSKAEIMQDIAARRQRARVEAAT